MGRVTLWEGNLLSQSAKTISLPVYVEWQKCTFVGKVTCIVDGVVQHVWAFAVSFPQDYVHSEL